LTKVIYWLVVLAVSLAIVIALVLLFESLDDSAVEGARHVIVP
jgi:hypothetical protein